MTGATPVGVVGLGLIGTALSKRLIAAGIDVIGYDIDPARREGLTALGGKGIETLPELYRLADRILVSVFNTDQVEEVIEGEDGLLQVANETGANRKIVFVVSTCDPDRVAALAERLAGTPVSLIESPVSGTSVQVANGDGVGLVAGDKADIDASGDVFSAIVKKVHYMGAVGNGGRTKLAINLILGLNRTALGEGLVFAEAIGLPLPAFLAAARDSAAYSQIMDVKGDMMITGNFTPQGRVAVSAKDAHMMLAAAHAAGQDLPLGRTYIDLLDSTIAAGEGDLDNSAVMLEVRRRKV